MDTVTCLNSSIGRNFALYNGDTVEVCAQLPERSADLIVYSPPFSDLYVYSDNERDMGNSTAAEFEEHYRHLLPSLYRALRPGRICAVHCMDLPARKSVEGWMGLRDFSGDLIRMHTDAGFHLLSRITVWKDPVTQMQRTKSHNLLYKNIQLDSTRNYPGLPDYVLLFRRPVESGEDAHAVKVPQDPTDYTLDQWQRWASPAWSADWSEVPDSWHQPVWTDIDQNDTLNKQRAREDADEKHICPLQLPLIRRLVKMYSNPGEVVLSPFAGIGSEGYVTLQEGRRFVGAELKASYFETAAHYLTGIENAKQLSLFR